MTHGDLADALRQAQRLRTPLDEATQHFAGRRPPLVITAVEGMDQAGDLGHIPHVDGIVGDRLVAAETDRYASVAQFAKRHHAAAQAKVTNGIVCDHGAGVGDEIHVVVVHPDGMNDVHAIAEQPQVFDVTYERAAEFFLAQHALQLGLEYMDEKRQVKSAAQVIERAEIIGCNALRSRTGDGGPQPPALGAVPTVEQVAVTVEQPCGVHTCWLARAGE